MSRGKTEHHVIHFMYGERMKDGSRIPEPWGGDAHTEDGGRIINLVSASGEGVLSVRRDEVPDLIAMLKDALSGD
jgi:hypothetical protein